MEEEIFDDLLAIASDESPPSPVDSLNTPSSLKTSRSCDVCAMAIDTKHASIHYGALTCYSCRAFFRRSLQKTRNPNFKCFKSGDCEVNPKSRRKCQKCRFEKCLKAGMRVEMVLTDTQKTLRFRKFLEKKKQKDSSASSGSRDLPSSSGENSCNGGGEDFSNGPPEENTRFAKEQQQMTESFPDPMVEPSRPVHRAFEKFKNVLQNLFPESPVQRLLDIIQDLGMTLLNHSNVLTIDISTPSSPSSSTNGSVTWMDAQLLRFKDAFKAVPYGTDLINEMIMHSYGVPVSKSFLPQSIAVWIERALILIQTEPSSQVTVDTTARAYQFAALHLTMLESCPSGLEQLTFAAGANDLEVWETKYKPFVRDSSFLALPLKECQVDISRMDLERMCVLQSKLARHISDMESFITFALVILFENTQSPDWDITDGYLSMWVDRINCKTEVTTRSTFQSLMGDVKDLADLLQAIHSRLQYT